MADDVDKRRLDGSEQTVGHLLLSLSECGVDGRHDEVEFGQAIICEIQGAVGADIAFDTSE